MNTFWREIRQLILVSVGGFLGTLCRYGLGLVVQLLWGQEWPLEIVIANLTGAFLLAYLSSWLEERQHLQHLRLFWGVGFLGAYTTFSTLVLGEALFLEKQQWFLAVSYLSISFLGGLGTTWLGAFAARTYNNWRRALSEEAKVV